MSPEETTAEEVQPETAVMAEGAASLAQTAGDTILEASIGDDGEIHVRVSRGGHVVHVFDLAGTRVYRTDV